MKKEPYFMKWKLLGSSSVWVSKITLKHIETIHQFFMDHSDLPNKKAPKFYYYQLSKELGIYRDQVRNAVRLLAMHDKPYLRIKAELILKGKKPKTINRIWLVRNL